MKAATWQHRLRHALVCLVFSLAAQTALARTADAPAPAAEALPEPSLPAGLPPLPALGEAMQRDLVSGLALNGLDPVSYQLPGGPLAGRAEYELIHDGIVWRFASAANRAAFLDAPATYAPAFAGFDPIGVANGVAVDSNPERFAVVGSRLFLFRSDDNRRRFLLDRSLLDKAETRWKAVLRTVAR
ncbi:MAG: YHS domain-containing (seleno)protein [Bosea sp. (in: a-proteobacteria)]|uniref:YHS domain-containing (seleno)protein n=1 Tax=Bosea sp. (in: a-proteobacteria) TaxID=1871050 RepID=UPI003F7BD5B0